MTTAAVEALRATRATPRRGTARRWPRVGLHAFLIATAIVWLAPLAWAVFTSFRPYADTQQHGYVSIPHTLSIKNYENAWTQGQILLHFWNSLLIAIPAIFVIL